MGKADRVSEQERAQALAALRACCTEHGRGVSGPEFEQYCEARRIGRPWRRHHLTTRAGRMIARWGEVVRSAGFEPAANPRRPVLSLPPGARRCQNAPECQRSPKGNNKFCDICHARWEHVSPDYGVADFARHR